MSATAATTTAAAAADAAAVLQPLLCSVQLKRREVWQDDQVPPQVWDLVLFGCGDDGGDGGDGGGDGGRGDSVVASIWLHAVYRSSSSYN